MISSSSFHFYSSSSSSYLLFSFFFLSSLVYTVEQQFPLTGQFCTYDYTKWGSSCIDTNFTLSDSIENCRQLYIPTLNIGCFRECGINLIFNNKIIIIGNNTYNMKFNGYVRSSITLSTAVYNYLYYNSINIPSIRIGSFSMSYTNPQTTNAGMFAVSLLTAILNYRFSNALEPLTQSLFVSTSTRCDYITSGIIDPFFFNKNLKDILSITQYIISTPYIQLPSSIRIAFQDNRANLYNAFSNILFVYNTAFSECTITSYCFVLHSSSSNNSNNTNITTESPTISPTPSIINTTIAPTSIPTETPTIIPTSTPIKTPTLSPTPSPTKTPTLSPTKTPTLSPTETPTETPTLSPTTIPTSPPPTIIITESPTTTPTQEPTPTPTSFSTISVCNCTQDPSYEFIDCSKNYISQYMDCIYACGFCLDNQCEINRSRCISSCFVVCINGVNSPPCSYCIETIIISKTCHLNLTTTVSCTNFN